MTQYMSMYNVPCAAYTYTYSLSVSRASLHVLYNHEAVESIFACHSKSIGDFSMSLTWGWTAGPVLCCLLRMWQTTWLMRCWSASSVCRCTQKCAERAEPSLERIWFFFLYVGEQLPCQKIGVFDAQEAFELSSLQANIDVQGSAVTPHVIRHSARKRTKRNACNCFVVIPKQQRRWHGLSHETFYLCGTSLFINSTLHRINISDWLNELKMFIIPQCGEN